MNCQEFDIEFDLLYNSISSNAAPSITEYEKSVFLTEAQEQIVRELYNNFERSEQVREYLNALIFTKTYSSDSGIIPREPLATKNENSLCYKIPDDAMFVLYEYLNTTNDCGDNYKVVVKPIKYDEYHRVSRNPFRKARKNEAIRVNITDVSDDTQGKYVEIVSTYPIYNYCIRYIKKPRPIIITDLPEELTINGMNLKSECELNENIHRDILEAAVRRAISTYKILVPEQAQNNNSNN